MSLRAKAQAKPPARSAEALAAEQAEELSHEIEGAHEDARHAEEQLEALSDGLKLPVGPDGVVRAADLGCGDFHYAIGLQQWLARHVPSSLPDEAVPRKVVLRGLELDGHGIYRDGHSRADHARARARSACADGGLVQFEVADAVHARLPEQDVVSLFFPFLPNLT